MNQDEQLDLLKVFYFVLAGLQLLAVVFMPLGTLLGVFTIVVLQRPSLKALFAT
ncbi:MAG: hypothetical protein Q8L48_30820 [Archangium sp.]|nr:hypothetical protein [Archangium sp.]